MLPRWSFSWVSVENTSPLSIMTRPSSKLSHADTLLMITNLEIKSVRLVLDFNPYDTVKQLINKRSQIEACYAYMCFILSFFCKIITFNFNYSEILFATEVRLVKIDSNFIITIQDRIYIKFYIFSSYSLKNFFTIFSVTCWECKTFILKMNCYSWI